ncbi:MAG: DUF664 domain-containing protein [Pedococcus sp.]
MTSPDLALLLDYLQGQRRHVLTAFDGLSDEDLQRAVLPSGWSGVQLLHHLALDDERFWVRAMIAGDAEAQAGLSENAWLVPEGLSVSDVRELYLREAELSDEVLAEVDLDAAPAWWPDFMGEQRMHTNRDVLLHVMVETAAHAGHADAVRELIDGKQWVVIT